MQFTPPDNFLLFNKNSILSKSLLKYIGHVIIIVPIKHPFKPIYGILINLKYNKLYYKFRLTIKLFNNTFISISPIKFNVFIKLNSIQILFFKLIH